MDTFIFNYVNVSKKPILHLLIQKQVKYEIPLTHFRKKTHKPRIYVKDQTQRNRREQTTFSTLTIHQQDKESENRTQKRAATYFWSNFLLRPGL